MFNLNIASCLAWLLLGGSLAAVHAAEYVKPANPNAPKIAPASNEGENAIKRFRVPKGFKVELFAAEPLFANPVAFSIDERGRFYVVETFRLHDGVTDIRGHMGWLDAELASKSVRERDEYTTRFEKEKAAAYTNHSDRVSLVWDSDADGKADQATVFADGFNAMADGLASGVLARKGNVWFTDIPNLWLLRDTKGVGVANERKSLAYGFGVRHGFLGHDLHGLRFGPDGKLYFSIGDRATHIDLPNGKVIDNTEDGSVFRCNPDGSELEIFARGLRNPQELAFDQYGNLFTGDNNSDGGDPARWVYVVEGGDSGWRIGWQFLNYPNARGPWLAERMCYPQWDGQAAYILPPIANIANGPSGLAYHPGTGLTDRYQEHFFLCDFRGGAGSGVHSFAVKPKGAGFELFDRSDFIWEVLCTDGDFGYDGSFYVSDWVNGWNKTGKGRIYRVYDPLTAGNPIVAETKRLIAEGFDRRSPVELAGLLTHPDMRIRQEAQFALVGRGEKSLKTLAHATTSSPTQLGRLHGVWGLGQFAAKKSADRKTARKTAAIATQAVAALLPLLNDKDAEVRAQAAKVLGDAKAPKAFDGLVKLLGDAQPRPRFFAAIALSKLGNQAAVPATLELLRANNNSDRHLRHAGVMVLQHCADAATLGALARDNSPGVRMAAVIALRRLGSAEAGAFLNDADPLVQLEAARAISDEPIVAALPQLASLAGQTEKIAKLPAGTKEAPGPRDALFRRVINAHFRLGGEDNARALAHLAATTAAPEAARAEALVALGEWARPSGRDRVTGLWRPLAPRDRAVAAGALQTQLTEILGSGSNSVKLAATKVAGQLGLQSSAASGFALAADTKQPANLRVEALRAMAASKDAKLAEAVNLALADGDESLRKEANKLQAQLQPNDAATKLRAVLASGSVGEKQSALATLATLEGGAADEIIGEWMDQMLAKKVPADLQLDVLDAAAKRTAATVKDKLQKFERERPAEDNLRSYRESLSGGDAAEGKKIFLERVEASCVRCHKVGGEGGEVGPDLTGIGTRKPREYILESITFPNLHIAEGFESLLVTMKNGTSYAGIIKSETPAVLEVNSPEDGVLKLNKADIKTRERGLSSMPEELRQVLTKSDLRDLVEYLNSLK